MNYKCLLIIFLVLCMLSCRDEEAAGPGEAATYIKFFGASNADIAYVARKTTDGGHILLGTTIIDNEGASVSKIKAIKVDQNGNTLWQKIYPAFLEDQSDYEVSLTGRSILVVEDGYIIVGDSALSNGITPKSLLVMKINDTPNDNSYEHLSLSYQELTGSAAAYDVMGLDILQDSEGNYRAISKVMNGNEIRGTVFSKIKADFSFDREDCNYEFSGKLDLVRSLHEAGSGDFVFGGTNKSGVIDNAILRNVPACFDSQGGSENLVTGPTNNYIAGQVVATGIGYAMVGTNVTATGQTDVFFALFNNNGGVRAGALKLYDAPSGEFAGIGDGDAHGLTIANTRDGGFIIGGQTLQDAAGEEDILLIKTDALGNVLWSKVIGNVNHERATHIQQAADGGYLLFGNTEFGGINTMVLIKTDQNGNIH